MHQVINTITYMAVYPIAPSYKHIHGSILDCLQYTITLIDLATKKRCMDPTAGSCTANESSPQVLPETHKTKEILGSKCSSCTKVGIPFICKQLVAPNAT